MHRLKSVPHSGCKLLESGTGFSLWKPSWVPETVFQHPARVGGQAPGRLRLSLNQLSLNQLSFNQLSLDQLSLMNDRLYAALYDAVLWPAERFYLRHLRRELLARVQGRVLEIGAGTGTNLPHYGKDARVVLSEPDGAMLRRAPLGGTPAVLACAERLAFAAGSFDTVVSTLVLCTVTDPAQALAEIRRVLRPAGQLLLLEHVGSADLRTARWQARLTPAWKKLARGCYLNRDTAAALAEAGFRIQSLERLVPVGILPLILAHAAAPDIL